jgi:hypothetical protein
MSEFNVQEYALLCMRLADSDLRTHFRRTDSMWAELADQSLVLH